MQKPIVLALPAKSSAIVDNLNPCPKTSVPKQNCPSMPSKPKMSESESINVEDARKQSMKTFPRTLQILFKKASQSKKTPWMVLRGKERRRNLKQIMQTLESSKVINPYSAEQFQSFKNAIEEYGEEGEEGMDVISEPASTSSKTDGSIADFQEVNFDFGTDYGKSDFLDLEREVDNNFMERRSCCKNIVFDDGDLMQLSTVEEVLNDFSKEKLF